MISKRNKIKFKKLFFFSPVFTDYLRPLRPSKCRHVIDQDRSPKKKSYGLQKMNLNPIEKKIEFENKKI